MIKGLLSILTLGDLGLLRADQLWIDSNWDWMSSMKLCYSYTTIQTNHPFESNNKVYHYFVSCPFRAFSIFKYKQSVLQKLGYLWTCLSKCQIISYLFCDWSSVSYILKGHIAWVLVFLIHCFKRLNILQCITALFGQNNLCNFNPKRVIWIFIVIICQRWDVKFRAF